MLANVSIFMCVSFDLPAGMLAIYFSLSITFGHFVVVQKVV